MSSDKRNEIAANVKKALMKEQQEHIISMGIHSKVDESYKQSHLWYTIEGLRGEAYTVVNTPKELWKVLVWLYADSEASLIRYVAAGRVDKVISVYQLRFSLVNIALQNDSCITEILKADDRSVSQWLLNIPTILTPANRQYAGYTNGIIAAGGMTVSELLVELKTLMLDLLWAYFKASSAFGDTCIANSLVESELSSADRLNVILNNSDMSELIYFVSRSEAVISSDLKGNSFDNIFNLAVKIHKALTSEIMNKIKGGTSDSVKFLSNDALRQALTNSSAENASFMKESVVYDKASRCYTVKAA